MKTSKRLLVAVLALLPLAAGTAFADPEHGYTRIFTFGDSLSDPGNTFALTGETSHPPFEPIPLAAYGVGGHHFQDGRTWIEYLAQEMGLTDWAKPAFRDPAFGNFAVAYAPARPVSVAPPSFALQVQAWDAAGHCAGGSMDDALFVIEIGGIDVLAALEGAALGQDPMPVLLDTIDHISLNIQALVDCGAQNFLIAKLPDAGIAPGVPDPAKPVATGLVMAFNQILQTTVVEALIADGLNVSTIDFFDITTMVTTNPALFGYTNITDTCLTFGVTQGAFCKNRDEYLFWDVLHPTKKLHALIAQIAYGQLPALD
jgi:phospholipase/lecithinase/hemolysin